MLTPVNELAQTIPKTHAPAGNTAAVITLAAADGVQHVIDKVWGSYSATPTGGSLTIAMTVRGTSVSLVHQVVGTEVNLDFQVPLQGDKNTAITITLAAGGGVITGIVNAVTR